MNAGQRAALKQAERALARAVDDLRQLLADAGLSHAAVARAAGISPGYLAEILNGTAKPSARALSKLAVPLGADLSVRMYANTGPTIRDRHQARIHEALLEFLGATWRPYSEAIVWQPVRGAIDAVIHDRRGHMVVATEIESDIRRIEQTVRWSKEKADALPSWSGWMGVLGPDGEPPRISQLLIVRRTRANDRIGHEFARQLAIAYPAHPEDALGALAGDKPWPGSALVWARIDRNGVRLLPTR